MGLTARKWQLNPRFKTSFSLPSLFPAGHLQIGERSQEGSSGYLGFSLTQNLQAKVSVVLRKRWIVLWDPLSEQDLVTSSLKPLCKCP